MAERRTTDIATGVEIKPDIERRVTSVAVMVERVTHQTRISCVAVMVEVGFPKPRLGRFGPRVQIMV